MKTDAELQIDVINELKWEPNLHHEHIGVAVQEGIVTLTGTVPTLMERKNAEKAVERVPGVISIVQKIELKIPSLMARDDESIAKAIKNRFEWNSVVLEQRVKASVSNGWVTLNGVVNWEYQRKSAENLVRELNGVKFITNNIKIKPALNVSNLKKDIENAMIRAAKKNSEEIKIDVSGSHVTLSGKVQSLKEKKMIEKLILKYSGVKGLQDNLQVSTK